MRSPSDRSGADGSPAVALACEGAIVAVAAFAVYSPCVYPSVAGGDSGELIVSAYELGVAHPPGYPLWTLLSWLTMTAFPRTANAAWCVGQLNAATSAASVGVLYTAMLTLSAGDRAAAALGVGLLATGRLSWTWAVTPEVFALNNLMIAILLLLLARFELAEQSSAKLKIATWGSFASGLSLCNQHTIVVYVAVIALYVLITLARLKALDATALVRLTAAAVAGLAPYVYLPLSAALSTSSRYSWGDHSTVDGLFKHVLRADYGTFDLGKDAVGVGFLGNLRAYSRGLVDELTYGGIAMAAGGLAACITTSWVQSSSSSSSREVSTDDSTISSVRAKKRSYRQDREDAIANPAAADRRQLQQQPTAQRGCPPCQLLPITALPVICVLVVALTCYLALFCWRANLDITKPLLLKVTERFWLQANIVVAAFACLGYSAVTRLMCCVLPNKASYVCWLSWTAAAAIVVLRLAAGYVDCDHSADHVVRDFANATLASFPAGALVLTRGDLPMITFRYLQICEAVRPDVVLVDQELLSYPWYARQLHSRRAKQPPSPSGSGSASHVLLPGDVWWPSHHVHRPPASFDFAELLMANYDSRDVFACIGVQEYDASWQKHFDLMPYGVCHQFVHKSNGVGNRSGADASRGRGWLELRQPYAAQWGYHHDGYPPGTWEKVANDEMWNAKMAKAFYLYSQASQASGKAQLLLYNESMSAYEQLLARHATADFPLYWHKNYALAAERVLATVTAYDATSMTARSASALAIKAANHFEIYARDSPDDPQRDAILAVAKRLKKAVGIAT